MPRASKNTGKQTGGHEHDDDDGRPQGETSGADGNGGADEWDAASAGGDGKYDEWDAAGGGDNPFLGLDVEALIEAADGDGTLSGASAREHCRLVIAAGVEARLEPDEIDALLRALKRSTKTGIGVLRDVWNAAKRRARQAERARAEEASGDAAIRGDWMLALQRDEFGNIIGNVYNTVVLLRSPAFAGMFDYDELQAAAMLRRPVPESGRQPPADFRARMVSDIDLTTVQARLQRLWVPLVTRSVVAEAIETVARDNAYHPIRDWLDGLAWDGKARLDSWLTDYLGAAAGESHGAEYLKEIGPKFLISMVARIYRPGCKVDYMVMFEGGQGSIKSSMCRALAGAAYFSDALHDVTSKDASQHLRGLWLVEIAELEAMSKVESTAMKAFITRSTERYRPPYGRKEVVEPRQCVFAGTTNEHAYLKDATGNRRYWPVAIDHVDLAALERDREQLFAEAAARFHKGEHWWPEPNVEARHIQPVQASRFAEDIWREPVETWLDGLGAGTGDDFPIYVDGQVVPDSKGSNVRKDQATIYDIVRYALGRRNAEMTQRDRLRIVAILNTICWVYSHKSDGRSAYRRVARGKE